MTRMTTKTATAVDFHYGVYGLVDATVTELEEAAAGILSLGRKTTDQVFELGKHLEHAATLVEEGTYGKWVKERCDVEPKTARNYRAIFRNLTPYRERIVWLGISPTVLIHLSPAQGEKIEEVLSFAEEHRRIKVSDVKALLKDEAASEEQAGADPFDTGGLEGLKAIIAAKTKTGLVSFLQHISEIRKVVGEALAAKASGKRLMKGKLADQVEAVARLAHRELSSLVLFVQPAEVDPRTIHESRLPGWSHWNAVRAMLYKLGGSGQWPDARELEKWLSTEVMPLLDWATTRTKLPAWPMAASDQVSSAPAPAEAMPNGLEAMGGVVQVEAPSLSPDEAEMMSAGDFDDADHVDEDAEVPQAQTGVLSWSGRVAADA